MAPVAPRTPALVYVLHYHDLARATAVGYSSLPVEWQALCLGQPIVGVYHASITMTTKMVKATSAAQLLSGGRWHIRTPAT